MDIDFSKKVLSAFKTNLRGLNSFSRLVMYELFSYCDYVTGTISLNTLDELARNDFQVDRLSGRNKDEVNGDTLRNAFRTIKKAKPHQFKFTTVGQRIVIEMPFIRELYEEFYNKNEQVAADLPSDVATDITQCQLDEEVGFYTKYTGDLVIEDAAATSMTPLVKKNNILKQNNNNEFSKSPISDSFSPTADTITRAIDLGFDNSEDPDEIQAFIDHNKASGSLWADFNPIYLRWLAQSQQRKTKKPNTPTISGRFNHGAVSKTDKRSLRERVIAAHEQHQLVFCEKTRRFSEPGVTSSRPKPIQYIDIHSLGPIN